MTEEERALEMMHELRPLDHPRIDGDRDTVVRAAKAAGYRRVNTAAGPVELDDWQPYGATPGDPRTVYPMTFRLILSERNPRIEDVLLEDDAMRGDRLAGVWQIGQ